MHYDKKCTTFDNANRKKPIIVTLKKDEDNFLLSMPLEKSKHSLLKYVVILIFKDVGYICYL